MCGVINNEIQPKAGMHVTCCGYSDRDPGTITDVGKNWFGYYLNKTEAVGSGMGHQDWTIKKDMVGEKQYAKKCGNKWLAAKYNPKTKRLSYINGGGYLLLDKWDKYYDWEF